MFNFTHCKKVLINPHWDTISHPSIWQNSKAWQYKFGKAVEHSPSNTVLVGMQNDTPFKERTMATVKKTKHAFTFLTQQTVIPLLGIYPEVAPSKIWKYICTRLFVTASRVTVKHWKLHKCPNIGEYLNTVWYIHKMEYYVTIERTRKISAQ